jgi:ribosome recycling factor
MDKVRQAMQKTVDFLTGELSSIRTGRANPALVSDLSADAYGNPTPIKQLGQVSVPEATVIVVAPWDKGLIQPIEEAVKQSEVGQVSNDGNLIRVTLPPMTEERRQEFVRVVGEKLEAAKVSLRNARREAIEAAEAEDLSEDDLKQRKDEVDKLVAEFQTKLDQVADTKKQELMRV